MKCYRLIISLTGESSLVNDVFVVIAVVSKKGREFLESKGKKKKESVSPNLSEINLDL